jgi:hypothetical protein
MAEENKSKVLEKVPDLNRELRKIIKNYSKTGIDHQLNTR